MRINKKNAFTLIELVFVVLMLGILIMATTMYLDGSGERRKIIEGQGCASSMGGEINNYIFYTLTSKNLKVDEENISPSFYIIQLTGGNGGLCTGGNTCNEINLSYQTGETLNQNNYKIYKTLDISKTCYQTKQPLKFYWNSGTQTDIIMNKGFISKKDNTSTFYITGGAQPIFTGDILIDLCLNKECSSSKQISKFIVDGRSQTISLKNCKIFSGDLCELRDGEKIEEVADEETDEETNENE